MKTYFQLIITEPHFSGGDFHDKCMAFRDGWVVGWWVVCIKSTAPIFRMPRVFEMYCWNLISGYHVVLNPYDLTS